MNTLRFDEIAKGFANRRLSRRRALAAAGAGLAAAGLSTAGAQDATPVATPGTAPADKVTYLFVQSYQSGSIAPKAGADGRYTVTLEQGLGQTIFFGDRPSRDVGATPTSQFLEGLGFSDDNPPNAALILETGSGETDIAVVELFNPAYDESTHTASYEIVGLESWEDDLDLGLQEDPTDLAGLGASFGAAHLFIDDCADTTVQCIDHGANDGLAGVYEGVPACWNYAVCMPCEPYGHVQPDRCSTQNYWTDKCNKDHSVCRGQCGASFAYPFANC
jgi:hypothetical protein